MGFKKTDIKTMEMKPFEKIGSEWMLITGEKDGKVNTMTASWGGVGVLWGKNVATVYIRPQRYTKQFVDGSDTFTLSFFGGEHMKELGYLGKVSGKEEPDKIERSGLHVEMIEGYPGFEEASLVLVCRKLYHDEIKPENFYGSDEDVRWYPEKDYHTMYIAEIVEAFQK